MIISRKRAYALSNAVFLLGLALLTYSFYWWPGILLVMGLSLACRHFLLGRIIEMSLSLAVFIGLFIVDELGLSLRLFLPLFLIFGAIAIVSRNFTKIGHFAN